MELTHLGRTGLEVSRLCLGTMNFGARTEVNPSFAIMDRAIDSGINFFDTANIYGAQPGATEEVIGKWFAQGGGRRGRKPREAAKWLADRGWGRSTPAFLDTDDGFDFALAQTEQARLAADMDARIEELYRRRVGA